MGWLRDLMITSTPPVSSYGRLAELALELSEWPDECRIKPRSLSTLFSKLDRGQDLDWLRDRPLVQRALAQLLHRPLGDIRLALGEPSGPADPRLVRLRDVRYSRELDLARDELPPGIPPIVLSPLDWKPLLWIAPSGSGRSLVGTQLTVRGRARHFVVREPRDLERIPERGALFLEFTYSFDPLELETPRLRLDSRPLCIAAPGIAPSEVAASLDDEIKIDTPSINTASIDTATIDAAPFHVASSNALARFTRVASPNVIEFLPELVDWISRYLGDDGHFDPNVAERWIRRVAIPLGACRTLGDALGWLGALDEMKPRSFDDKSLDEVIEGFVRRRLREALESTSAGLALADQAYSRLLDAAARTLVSGEGSLSEPHSLERFRELLHPPGNDEAPDPTWFRVALASGLGRKVTQRELSRVARQLPPAAFQLVRALEQAQLLTAVSGTDRFQLGPHFLTSHLEARSVLEALRLSPFEWGHALLVAPEPERMIEALLDAAERGRFAPFHDLIEHFDEESPELVAALEASVIACGLARLGGARLPEEIREALVEDALRVVVVFPERLAPRFLPASAGPGLYRDDVWLSAWWAFTDSRAVPTAFDPSQPRLLAGALDAGVRASTRVPAHYRVPLLALLDRHRSSAEHPSAVTRLLDALDRSRHENAATTTSSFLELFRSTLSVIDLDTCRLVARSRGFTDASFYAALWSFLAHEPSAFDDGSAAAREAWRSVPQRTLEARIRERRFVDWRALLPHQFSGLAAGEALVLPLSFVEHAPRDVVLDVWKRRGLGAFEPNALRALVELDRDVARTELPSALAQLSLLELARLFRAPSRALVDHVLAGFPPREDLAILPSDRLDLVRAFLLDVVRRRLDDGGAGYALLAFLESKLLRMRRSSSVS